MHTRTRTKGFTLIELLVVISIIGILAGIGIGGIGPIMRRVREFKRNANLQAMHKIMQVYLMDYNRYPTTSINLDRSSGVRDLYLLYEYGYLGKDDLELLQPPGANLIPFSDDPSIDEFDQDHIGFSYNSTAFPGGSEAEPVLADQGVSDGVLDENQGQRGLAPYSQNSALVLFSDGRVKKITADRRGRLSTSDVSADEWGKLVD